MFYVEKGYTWVVRLELASVRLVEANKKRKNEVFLAFYVFFTRHIPWNQTRDEVRQRSKFCSMVFSFLTFFDLFLGLTVAESKKKNIQGTGKNDADRGL